MLLYGTDKYKIIYRYLIKKVRILITKNISINFENYMS